MDRRDTIVAVSSPPGRSWRGLIRLAGPEAFAAAAALLQDATLPPSHHMSAHRLAAPLPPLPVWVSTFHPPRSYTGDAVVELLCPGHPALLERIVQQCLEQRLARLAEPGEFTYRAFQAGKLTLTQAEGIAAVIAAASDQQLAAAQHLQSGELAAFAQRSVDALGNLLALVEAGIDFVDQEDVVPIAPPQLHAKLTNLLGQVQELRNQSRAWGVVEALPRVVLVGPPSAGKSTLFNALLGRRRSVVDALPGTTRDLVAEPLRLNADNEIMLVDLAGLDDQAASLLDRQAQERTREAIARADVALLLGTAPNSLPDHVPSLRVATRSDLLSSDDRLRQPADVLLVSGVTGQGLPELRKGIVKILAQRQASPQAQSFALQPRHTAALQEASAALGDALTLIHPAAHALDFPELVASALRRALDQLADLGGLLTPDDVIGRVFATFCVGK